MNSSENVKPFNVLVVDDDPLVLESARTMYAALIENGSFARILGKSRGSISLAINTREAELTLMENFNKDPDLLQVMHVDQRMPDETGSEFVNRMRWKYAGKKIGALLVTGYATDTEVVNSREAAAVLFRRGISQVSDEMALMARLSEESPFHFLQTVNSLLKNADSTGLGEVIQGINKAVESGPLI